MVSDILKKFTKEVLKLGTQACLPVNLSDEWLEYLGKELSFIQNMEEIGPNFRPPSCALSAIFKIILSKNRKYKASPTEAELFDKMQEYYTELELEKMSRWSVIQYEPATIDTIFTNRNVGFRYK